MATLLDVPPELRALIFERISYQTLVDIGQACPSWLPEVTGVIVELLIDDFPLSLYSSFLKYFPRLRIMEHIIVIEDTDDDLRPLARCNYLISSVAQGNKVLTQARSQDNQMTLIARDVPQINWNRGALTVDLSGNIITNLNLYLGDVTITSLTLYDYGQPAAVIAGFVLAILSQKIRNSEYRFMGAEKPVGASAFRVGIHLNNIFIQRTFVSRFPGIKQLIFPLVSNSIDIMIDLCPDLVKVGYQVRPHNLYNSPDECEVLRGCLDRHPNVSFVVYVTRSFQDHLLTFIQSHPRLELAI